MSNKLGRAWMGVAMLAIILLAAGCNVRSISNSGYPDDRWGSRSSDNPLYQGELTEFDVLGIDPDRPMSSADIAQAFSAYSRPIVKRGGAIMVIQSGAMFPDEPMIRELNRHFATTPFSGVPVRRHDATARPGEPQAGGYATALRLAAAKGGYETIYCYWGILEAAKESQVTKVVSWVPLIGLAIPDETQQMRIRLKVAVIDVRSGRWSIFTPDTFQDQSLSASFGRRESDQAQVAMLKEKAYAAAAADFMKIYVQ